MQIHWMRSAEIMGLSYQSETKVEHAEYFRSIIMIRNHSFRNRSGKDEDTKEIKTRIQKKIQIQLNTFRKNSLRFTKQDCPLSDRSGRRRNSCRSG